MDLGRVRLVVLLFLGFGVGGWPSSNFRGSTVVPVLFAGRFYGRDACGTHERPGCQGT